MNAIRRLFSLLMARMIFSFLIFQLVALGKRESRDRFKILVLWPSSPPSRHKMGREPTKPARTISLVYRFNCTGFT